MCLPDGECILREHAFASTYVDAGRAGVAHATESAVGKTRIGRANFFEGVGAIIEIAPIFGTIVCDSFNDVL